MKTKRITTALDYVSGSSALKEGEFGISPSSINNFITQPHIWYKDQVLKDKTFLGSTASVLGTICHFCAEDFTKTGKVDKNEIYNYIYQQCCLIEDDALWISLSDGATQEEVEENKIDYLRKHCNNPEIDGNVILDQWKFMGQAIIHYLSQGNVPDKSEEMIKTEIIPGYFATGSADGLKDTILIDYKTTSDKSPKNYIPMNYKYQLLTYAYIYNKLGIKVDRIRIVWITRHDVGRVSETTGKPLKDYPAKTVEVTEMVSRVDLEFIESILKLIAESVQASKDHPELKHIIWKDYRLKQV